MNEDTDGCANESVRTEASLTDRQRELLTMLAEEAAEVVQAATKILRHGPWSYNPDQPKVAQTHNLSALNRELRDLVAVVFLLDGVHMTHNVLEVDATTVVRKLKYTHHQQEN